MNWHDRVNQSRTDCDLGSRAKADAKAVEARNRCKMNRQIREVVTHGPFVPKVVIDKDGRKPNGPKKPYSKLTSKEQLRQRRKHRQTGGGEMLEILAYEIEGQHCSPYASTDEYGE